MVEGGLKGVELCGGGCGEEGEGEGPGEVFLHLGMVLKGNAQ